MEKNPKSVPRCGDVVWLKSGGPAMTMGVDCSFNPQGRVECHWFDADEKEHTIKVPLDALTTDSS